jgi:hypothetical protein
MRRLSVRRRDEGYFEVGPAGRGPTVSVRASSRHEALVRGKQKLRDRGKFADAGANSYRNTERINTIPEAHDVV